MNVILDYHRQDRMFRTYNATLEKQSRKMIITNKNTDPIEGWLYWRDLSWWNFYFFIKFSLLWGGYLNFHPLLNLIFVAFLLVPVPSYLLYRCRDFLAIPLGIMLFWNDTWLPGPESLFSQGSQLAEFSTDYILDLVLRFINWEMIGTFFVLWVFWVFISQVFRVSFFVSITMIWINISPILPELTFFATGPSTSTVSNSVTNANGTTTVVVSSINSDTPDQTAPPTSDNLTAWLKKFYESEKNRKTLFPDKLPDDAIPFDLLIINICSLSWSDIEASGLTEHPLWKQFDLLFKHFNSATSYSGPAAVRLLRASCGQQSHTDLYQPTNNECYLFSNLEKLGFHQQLMLGHNGVFGGFLEQLNTLGGLQSPLMDQSGLPVILKAFDDSPVYDDLASLNRWQHSLSTLNMSRTATFYNTLPLHDGNHYIGETKTADYKARAQKLFDELNNFFIELDKSGRKVMVVVIPEHGAALKGDKMQVSGLRDIPSQSITNVPAAVKFFGIKSPHAAAPVIIDKPTSHLAISELVARALDGKMFSEENIDWQKYISNLPQSAEVSENSSTIVVQYQGKPYVQLNGGTWVPYPQ